MILFMYSLVREGIETANDEKINEREEMVHVLRLFSSAVAKASSPSFLSCHSFWTSSHV